MADEMKVTKEMGILEVVQKYPRAGEIFSKYGMQCVGCMAARFENIEQGAKAHGMEDDVIENMVKDLNVAAQETPIKENTE